MTASSGASSVPPRLGKLSAAVMMGTLLNPLNSSMIAVALIPLQAEFRVSVAAASWVISAFYLAAAVGQPLMGRLADQFGPRRIFCLGLALVGTTAALTPFSPGFGWLLGFRVAQAVGTSAAYPAGLAMLRLAAGGVTPAGALGALSVAGSVSAAFGPVIGGFLVASAGWPAIFVVNLPFALLGLVLARRWLPADRPRAAAGPAESSGGRLAPARQVLRLVDLPGILFFSAMLTGLLAFLLSLRQQPLWWLLPVAPLAAALLVWQERRVSQPFLNLAMLAANRSLLGVYAQFAAVTFVFYTVFFALPVWLEQARHYNPAQAGLLLLPIAGMGVLTTPLAARLIDRFGPRPALVIGAVSLTVGSLLLLVFQASTPVTAILVVGAILGIPNGFNNLGLQAALYETAPARAIGAASGLFQTCRYLGAILSTSLLGLVFGGQASSAGLHGISRVIAAISILLIAASFRTRRDRR